MTLTAEEKRACEGRSSTVIARKNLDMPGCLPQGFAYYYDRETGKQHRLPTDPYSIANYVQRGLLPGKAPEELRLKWEASEAERAAECDRRAKEAAASSEGQRIAGGTSNSLDEAVDKRVAEIFKRLGIDLTALEAAGVPEIAAEAAPEPPEEAPKQLKLL